jgi:hypothetical protein
MMYIRIDSVVCGMGSPSRWERILMNATVVMTGRSVVSDRLREVLVDLHSQLQRQIEKAERTLHPVFS